MSSEDIDVTNSDEDDLADFISSQLRAAQSSTGPCQSTVSARTDGIRGKRYNDFEMVTSEKEDAGEGEEGEEIDIMDEGFVLETTEQQPGTVIKPVEPETEMLENVDSHPINLTQRSDFLVKHEKQSPPPDSYFNQSYQLRPSYGSEVENRNDINGIIGLIGLQRQDEKVHIDGVGQLMSNHRVSNMIDIDSSDDDEYVVKSDDESSSDESILNNAAVSLTSDTAKMSRLDIRDHLENREIFPEVEIVDLSLTDSEEILSLGRVYQIVDDFVVVKCSDTKKILDLDSMIFDGSRKCVGYIFEVLGRVSEPFYSLHFNTNSDILSLGLHMGQELYYSPNERYSRYVLIDMLREMEHRKRDASDGESDEEGDEVEESQPPPPPPEKVASRKRKSPEVLQRTTVNYSLKYRSMPARRTPEAPSPARNYHPTPSSMYCNPPPFVPPPPPSIRPQSPFSVPSSSSATSSPFLRPNNHRSYLNSYPQDNSKSNSNSFQKSVLASFMDPQTD